MKRFKLLLLTLAISISTITYAEKSEKIYDLNALSAEIELLLRNANQTIPEGETITLFFSISEEMEIQALNVASTNKKTSELLEKKLQHQKVDGRKWREGMIYELSIKGQKTSTACVTLN
jgi:hypothetical protein